MRIRLLPLAIVFALSACNQDAAPPSTEVAAPTETAATTESTVTHEELAALFDEYWEASLELNPLELHLVRRGDRFRHQCAALRHGAGLRQLAQTRRRDAGAVRPGDREHARGH
jgi:hypothetical protein